MRVQRAKLWGGRFGKRTDPLVEAYTSSLAADFRLARYDVLGSIAHAKMLGRCRIIPAGDAQRLVRGLTQLLRAIDRGGFSFDASAEDIHSLVQQRLERLIGPVARKLQTARSRNDQVALDLRLYCRDAVTRISEGIRGVQRALVGVAGRVQDVVIPGYTHLQRAQPVLLAHHLLAYVEMLERDHQRLADARARIDVLPLGAGALAGTSLPIDRRYVAKLLGFSRIAENSMDAVSDRDFAVELVSVLALLGVHLSRLAEDLILWVSSEFGLAELDEAFATGSSPMPQKKNPDVLELLRGQAGIVTVHLTALLSVLKGLPLAYNRDLQWDKRPVCDSVQATDQGLAVLARLLTHLRIHRAGAARLLDERLCATDLAEDLVRRGVAFRDAHELVGRLIRLAEARGVPMQKLTPADLRRVSPRLTPAALRLLDPARGRARERRTGSTAPRR